MGFKSKAIEQNLSDLLRLHKKDVFLTLNCHSIGIIESFDRENQTVSAKVAYKKKYYEVNETNNDFKEVSVDYPILVDCPAITLSGGAFSLKMPIKKGDECLILFNDRSIDEWFKSGRIESLESSRLHSFSDGLALVGVKSLNNSISGFEEDKVSLGDSVHDLILGGGEASLKKGSSQISVKDKITISNQNENLKDILSEMAAAIGMLSTAPNGSGAAIPATKIQFDLFKARIEGLLE